MMHTLLRELFPEWFEKQGTTRKETLFGDIVNTIFFVTTTLTIYYFWG